MTGPELYARARTLIPGGTQLLSKRPEMALPELWPSYYSRARGVETWDLDGRRFVDMSYMGIGACVLGFADRDVDRAVQNCIGMGSMATLNCPEEVELAELLCQLHPWAQMVRYARCGGEAMAIAVRIARARTGREKVAFCGYHGWHDWYLAANLGESHTLDGHLLSGLEPAGVPVSLRNTSFPFRYNRIEELKKILSTNGRDFAAIVMEPIRSDEPTPGFLEEIRAIASEIGSALIFDEVSCGWRLTNGGAHLKLGVTPDIAVFAKAMSNGYPMAAIIGTESVMQAAQSTFISSTYWTERIGPTAALATIRKFVANDVSKHLVRMGKEIQEGWVAAGKEAGIGVTVSGIPPLSHFRFDSPNGQAMRTLFTKLMLEKGFLATASFYPSFAHQEEHIEAYLQCVRESFAVVGRAQAENLVEAMLGGPVAHAGFQRLT